MEDIKVTGELNTEAPASVNVRFDLRGFDCMLTMRGDKGGGVLEAAARAIDDIVAKGGAPISKWSKPAESKPSEVKPEPVESQQMCEVHGVLMNRHEKDGQVWYSHKLGVDANGKGIYCKGQKKRDDF